MKPISSRFFASLFRWNQIFGFKTVTILAGLRCAQSLNPWLPTQLQVCRVCSLRETIFSYFCCNVIWTIQPSLHCLFSFNRPAAYPPECVCVCVLLRQCQEVRYDCIIRYRPQPQPGSIAWYWFLKPVQQAWNCPHSEFRRRSAFICQENIHALLSRVSCGSVWSSACLCYVDAWLLGFQKMLFICVVQM